MRRRFRHGEAGILLQPVGVSPDVDDVAVMQQPVQERCCRHGVAEDLAMPEMLARIDRAAKRLGISRSAFIVSSTAERLERME